MIELNKIININNKFIYYDNKNRQLITPTIRNELLVKIQSEFELADYIKYVISAYMDDEKNKYDKILNIKTNCIYTGDYVNDVRLHEMVIKCQGRYEVLHDIYTDFSKKIEKYYKWMSILKHDC